MSRLKIYMPLILILIASFLFNSCEKDITIDLPAAEDKIVVEGWIENDQAAMVILSRNASYFAPIDSNALTHMFNVDAVVSVKEVETGIEEVLAKTLDFNFVPPILYKGSSLKGKVNHHYLLTIVVDGKTITANTVIPDTIPIDSAWFETDPLQKDTLGLLWLKFQDPSALGNYYRIFTKRLSKDTRFVPVWGSIYDDAFFNGQLIEYSFFRGADRYAPQPEEYSESDFYFKFGDTIVSKFTVLDKAHYDFWRSIENAMYAGSNPFASPATIYSNVDGALGVWGGYAAVYDTAVAVAP